VPQTGRGVWAAGVAGGWFADPEYPQPSEEQGPERHEYERCGAAHTLKEHATHDEHEDGRHAGDQPKGGIGLTALRGRKEVTQPGYHRGHKEGATDIRHKNGPEDPGQRGRQWERDQPRHR